MEGGQQVYYVFGDQTAIYDQDLAQLLQATNNSIVTAFLDRSFYALRQRISRLSPSQQKLFPRFTSIADLLLAHRDEPGHPAVSGALASIYQLACFINYHGEYGRPYPSPSNCTLMGSCIGLLTCVAITSCSNVGELVALAADLVALNIPLGLSVMSVRKLVESSQSSSGIWTAIVQDLDEKVAMDLIQNFMDRQEISSGQQPYISAVGSRSISITAPPSVLDRFLDGSIGSRFKYAKVPYINGPYHASHLYCDEEVQEIAEMVSSKVASSRTPTIPVVSSRTGEVFESQSIASLIRNVLGEILLHPVRWDRVTRGCVSRMPASGDSACIVFPVGNCAQGLISALQAKASRPVEVGKLADGITTSPNVVNESGSAARSKLAIIGMSGRFPEADGIDAFWNLLYKGLDVHKTVPPDRWDIQTHVDLSGERANTSKVPYGCWIREPGLFDPRFFNMSPREALQADPAQRLVLLTAAEALEMAGFVPDSTQSTQRNRVGVFYGMTSDDYREVNSGQDIDTYFIPGGNRAFTPGRVNYFFKFSGPSVSVDTACSSSLAAIHLACNALWRNDCDTAVTGGVNILTNPDNHAGLDRGHFLSRTGNCKTFDDDADGYCRADGAGTVIIKRLEDALEDGDPILGIIAAGYTNHSAESVSITRPHVGAQEFIFKKLLNDTSTHPHDISYVEMHGTGTQAGDAVELQSVLDVLAPEYSRSPSSPLYLGSAKANIGHGESASGVSSLIKVLLMMKHNIIPPHAGIKTRINQKFPTDFVQRNVHIPFEPTPWPRAPGKTHKTFVNNFSAAGGNTALLLEDTPSIGPADHDPRAYHLITVSARSATALRNNVASLIRYMSTSAPLSEPERHDFLAQLAYTTTARRLHYSCRVAAVASDISDIQEALAKTLDLDHHAPAPSSAVNIGFVFTGQGAQYTGMGKALYANSPHFRSVTTRLNCLVQKHGFPSIVPLIDGSIEVDKLRPVSTQLGTTCLQIALAEYWKSLGIRPSFVLGHSLGEYAALHIAGVLTASDTILLCGKRACLLEENCERGTHSMLAIRSSIDTVRDLIDRTTLTIACINSPMETVISGPTGEIRHLAEQCSSRGIKATMLRVPFAFHSGQVNPILDSFGKDVARVTFHKPEIPFISALLGEIIDGSNMDLLGVQYLVNQCREPVNFLKALQAGKMSELVQDGTIWVEVGPHPICSGMIKATHGSNITTLASLRKDADAWKVVSDSLSDLYLKGMDINWREYHSDFRKAHRVLELPCYAWDLKNYWIPYKGDFCLTKGAPPPITEAPLKVKHLTTTAQKIVEERDDNQVTSVTVENNMADPDLNRVIQGHRVNGAALTPSSLYADIAQTLVEYIISNYRPEHKGLGMDVSNMTVPKPLIAEPGDKFFRVSATMIWAEQSADICVYSVTPAGEKIHDHARCQVKLFDGSQKQSDWARIAYLIKRSISLLRDRSHTGEAHSLQRGMVYKLFSALVDYDENFKNIQEVVLDSEGHEATARVQLQKSPGNFHRNPFWIDSFGHLSGFVMNASDATDSKKDVFVNHGWCSMQCLKPFSPDVTYQTYVKMQPWKDSIWAGDVYILEGDEITALFGGVKFQALARRVLDTVLPPAVAPMREPKGAPRPAFKGQDSSKAKASRQKSSQQSSRSTSVGAASLISPMLEILASEVGIPASEMGDDLIFADYGIDSLMSLTITGKYREQLDIDLDSSVFADYSTLGQFKDFLGIKVSCDSSHSSSNSSSSVRTSSSNTSCDSAGDGESSISTESDDDNLREVLQILGEEIGIPVQSIDRREDLADLGVDSLLSLTVLGRIRDQVGLDLPSSFFQENPTLDAVEAALQPLVCPDHVPSLSATAVKEPDNMGVEEPSTTRHPPASSILLQGNPRTAQKKLFLFPDGSGSAASYATIPALGPDICVYGLNCPYMKSPEKLKCSLDGLTRPYVDEIRRRQPTGPYNFGGWSAGGICAYDAARHLLLEEGERVDRLILLDSPFPIGLEKLPPRLYRFFESVGLFGDGKRAPPDWLLPHFLAFIDSLDAYKASPLPFHELSWADKLPATYLVWANNGVCGKPGDPRPEPAEDGTPDPREMLWLLNDRTDLGPNQWDILVGLNNIKGIEVLPDANHFTMMAGDNAKSLASFLGKWMSS